MFALLLNFIVIKLSPPAITAILPQRNLSEKWLPTYIKLYLLPYDQTIIAQCAGYS